VLARGCPLVHGGKVGERVVLSCLGIMLCHPLDFFRYSVLMVSGEKFGSCGIYSDYKHSPNSPPNFCPPKKNCGAPNRRYILSDEYPPEKKMARRKLAVYNELKHSIKRSIKFFVELTCALCS